MKSVSKSNSEATDAVNNGLSHALTEVSDAAADSNAKGLLDSDCDCAVMQPTAHVDSVCTSGERNREQSKKESQSVKDSKVRDVESETAESDAAGIDALPESRDPW